MQGRVVDISSRQPRGEEQGRSSPIVGRKGEVGAGAGDVAREEEGEMLQEVEVLQLGLSPRTEQDKVRLTLTPREERSRQPRSPHPSLLETSCLAWRSCTPH